MVQNASRPDGVPGRGRPLGFDAGTVVERALTVFWRAGYRPTSVAELEMATGLARSSLYNSFGSKRELFLKGLAGYARAFGDRMAEPLECGTGGLDDICAFLDLLELHVAEPAGPSGCLVVNSLVEVGDADAEVWRIVDGYLDRFRACFAAALARAARRREIVAVDLQSRADLLVALVIGVSAASRGGAACALPLVAAARDQVERWRI